VRSRAPPQGRRSYERLPDIVPTFSNVAIFLPRRETVHQRQVPDNSKLIQNDISPPTVAKEAERETPERSDRFLQKSGARDRCGGQRGARAGGGARPQENFCERSTINEGVFQSCGGGSVRRSTRDQREINPALQQNRRAVKRPHPPAEKSGSSRQSKFISHERDESCARCVVKGSSRGRRSRPN
jgi:hypothetical protein